MHLRPRLLWHACEGWRRFSVAIPTTLIQGPLCIERSSGPMDDRPGATPSRITLTPELTSFNSIYRSAGEADTLISNHIDWTMVARGMHKACVDDNTSNDGVDLWTAWVFCG